MHRTCTSWTTRVGRTNKPLQPACHAVINRRPSPNPSSPSRHSHQPSLPDDSPKSPPFLTNINIHFVNASDSTSYPTEPEVRYPHRLPSTECVQTIVYVFLHTSYNTRHIHLCYSLETDSLFVTFQSSSIYPPKRIMISVRQPSVQQGIKSPDLLATGAS